MTKHKGYIYKIYSDKTHRIYIGSTSQYMLTRFLQHTYSYRQYEKGKCNYTTVYDIFKLGGDIRWRVLETMYFDNPEELFIREGEYMRKPEYRDIIVNKLIPGYTQTQQEKQHYHIHKELYELLETPHNLLQFDDLEASLLITS